jgi:hypothetical protein
VKPALGKEPTDVFKGSATAALTALAVLSGSGLWGRRTLNGLGRIGPYEVRVEIGELWVFWKEFGEILSNVIWGDAFLDASIVFPSAVRVGLVHRIDCLVLRLSGLTFLSRIFQLFIRDELVRVTFGERKIIHKFLLLVLRRRPCGLRYDQAILRWLLHEEKRFRAWNRNGLSLGLRLIHKQYQAIIFL